jgi:hypothetical protein
MREPTKIEFFKDCIPKKGVWYDHFGTIFISVMRKSKPYTRRKSVLIDNKIDNELSEWHREWQYDNIELNYGVEQFGAKSYEISINVNGEIHRIDNVVKNIAIEFQHTLSVGIEEMDLRFNAHSDYGFLPYLVIDLTDFSKDEFESSLNSEKRNPLRTKLIKWLKSDYCKSNNLFIDFKDGIYRIVNALKIGYIPIDKTYFIENILNLEKELTDAIDVNNKIIAKEKEQQRIRQIELKKKEEIEKEKTRIENLKREKRSREREFQYFYQEKEDNLDFKFFNICFQNPVIKPYVIKYQYEIFEYHTYTDIEDGILEKNHNYYSKDGDAMIIYRTINIVKGKKTEYWYAEITIREKNKSIAEFKWERGNNPIKKVEEENEFLPF